jgi:hypothetical protein
VSVQAGLFRNEHGAPENVRRFRARRRMACSLAGTWSLATLAFFCAIATVGVTSHVPDIEFRRSTMIEPSRVTITPPRLSPLMMASPDIDRHTRHENAAKSILPHIRKVDLSRAHRSASTPGQPLLFLDHGVLLPAKSLDPALNLVRASRLLMARLIRPEGRTPGRIEGAMPAGTSPIQGVSHAALTLSRPDGSTPGVNRAVALASVTPAPIEPEIVQAASLKILSVARLHLAPKGETSLALRLPHLDLADPETRAREQKCLAEAVYFEARSEPEAGQAAVAQVVLNRAKSGLYPGSICGVVYQNRHRFKACQFTFACEGKSLAIQEPQAWLIASRIAREVLEGETYLPAVGASTHYHADYVSPYWSRKLKRTDRIGRHIFHRLRPGQT